MFFDVQLLSGAVVVGQLFSLWDTHHRFDLQVAELHKNGEAARLMLAFSTWRVAPAASGHLLACMKA